MQLDLYVITCHPTESCNARNQPCSKSYAHTAPDTAQPIDLCKNITDHSIMLGTPLHALVTKYFEESKYHTKTNHTAAVKFPNDLQYSSIQNGSGWCLWLKTMRKEYITTRQEQPFHSEDLLNNSRTELFTKLYGELKLSNVKCCFN